MLPNNQLQQLRQFLPTQLQFYPLAMLSHLQLELGVEAARLPHTHSMFAKTTLRSLVVHRCPAHLAHLVEVLQM
jgi:hypothetical protein